MSPRTATRALLRIGAATGAGVLLASLVLSPAQAATATPKPTASATASATPKPTASATPKPTTTATPKPTASATPKPTATATPRPTASATPRPTATPKPSPTPTATPKPPAIPKKLTQAKTDGGTTVVLPLVAKTYTITSAYGARCIPVRGGSTFHYGLDQAVADGTPIYAVASGTVSSVVAPRNGAAGYVSVRSVIDGQVTYIGYVHMWNPGKYVKLGQAVSVGQHIADVGASGPATGPHLHLEVWQNAFYGWGTAVDPAKWLAAQHLPVVSLAKAYRAAAAPTKCTYYPTYGLRVRSGPSTSDKILKTVPANTTLANKPGVKINRFIPVTVTTASGKKISGWVSSDYISQYKTYSLAKKATVRARATSASARVATISAGRQVTLLGKSGKWSHVRVAGYAGWVPTKSVRAGL